MKILRKGTAALLCILMALSNTSMAFAEELDSAKSDTNVTKTDMDADSAIISEVQAVAEARDNEIETTSVTSHTISLNAGKGTGTPASITLEKGNILPQLPAPSRTGWTFEGWYTAEVTENFWGDQEGESFSALLKKCDGDREEAVKKDFTWIVESKGDLVKAGQELSDDVHTLYAMYKPTNGITIRWHYNGWKKNTGVYLTHYFKEYDSPVAKAELDTFLPWEGHEITGWYTAKGEEWKFDQAITDEDNGRVYYISSKVVTENLDLYARWTGRTEPDSISLNSKNQLVEPGESVSVTASYFPLSADAPQLEWSVEDHPDVKVSQQVSDDGLKITLSIDEDADVIQSNKYVTVTAKSPTNPDLTAQVSITVGHSWKMTGYKDSTCDRAGVKNYQCTKHPNAKKDVAINPDGHRFVKSDSITKEPTCVVEGSYTDIYTCYICNTTKQVVTTIPATGIHTWNDGDITTPPTCADSGIKTYTCLDCHHTMEEEIPATGLHIWDNGEVTTDPTCAETGIMTFTCSGCAGTYERIIPATEQHQYEKTSIVVDRVPDCGNDGLHTDIYACNVCGAEKTEQIIDPATGEHDFYEFVNLNLGKRNHYQGCKVCGMTEFLYTEQTELGDCVIVLDEEDCDYNGGAVEPTVTVIDGSTELVIGQDYTVSYSDNVNVGTATVQITGKGNYTGTETMTFAIKKGDNLITASDVSMVYSKKAQKFSIGAKCLGNTELTYSSNHKSVKVSASGEVTVKAKFTGQATITIKSASTDGYNSTAKTITVTVNPSDPTLTSVKNIKKTKMQIKWKKNTAATGYELQYSTDDEFRNDVVTTTITKKGTGSKTFKSMTMDEMYYVRVRTYKTVSGVKYYSGWSDVKMVTISK